jgi:hypothetical protein
VKHPLSAYAHRSGNRRVNSAGCPGRHLAVRASRVRRWSRGTCLPKGKPPKDIARR